MTRLESDKPGPLLTIHDLKKHFPIRKGLLGRTAGYVYAVNGVNFSIRHGETLGLVGESGCGKSTVGRCILKLYEPTAGQIIFEDQDIARLDKQSLTHFRMNVQMIFQDPYSSLNPRLRVRDIIGETLKVHGLVPKGEVGDRVKELMSSVGLQTEHMKRYPHEFSGGQRQRIGIARALAVSPKLIVADEPVSALDVSIQAQVINLLEDLRGKFGLAFLIIAHDLAVVEHMSDRIAVMYLGKIVELASDHEIYCNPKHPYSQTLLSAVPVASVDAKEQRKKRHLLKGDVPSPINLPAGCHFHTRCPQVMDDCRHNEPPMLEVSPGHFVKCLLYS